MSEISNQGSKPSTVAASSTGMPAPRELSFILTPAAQALSLTTAGNQLTLVGCVFFSPDNNAFTCLTLKLGNQFTFVEISSVYWDIADHRAPALFFLARGRSSEGTQLIALPWIMHQLPN